MANVKVPEGKRKRGYTFSLSGDTVLAFKLACKLNELVHTRVLEQMLKDKTKELMKGNEQ